MIIRDYEGVWDLFARGRLVSGVWDGYDFNDIPLEEKSDWVELVRGIISIYEYTKEDV